MNLYTKIDLPKVENQISYSSNLFFLGSCFAENIGNKFTDAHFSTLQNPFGILFHPFGIEQFLSLVSGETSVDENTLLFHEETWKSYQAHSKLKATTKEELLELMKLQLQKSKDFLASTSHVFISLGTSWGYYKKETPIDQFVVNCHKQPNYLFDKKIASVGDLEHSIQKIIHLISSLSKAKIWFTVSPVRHQKDGWTQNTRSKSNLISALHNTLDSHTKVGYFPAYEVMMDELRDYRFYARDLLHPNELAIDYMWKHIETCYFSEATKTAIKKVSAYQKLKNHRRLSQHQDELRNSKLAQLESELKALGISSKPCNE
jgi:hypothetical protein